MLFSLPTAASVSSDTGSWDPFPRLPLLAQKQLHLSSSSGENAGVTFDSPHTTLPGLTVNAAGSTFKDTLTA
jgi:hypothetical protein